MSSIRKILIEMDKDHELKCYTYAQKLKTYVTCPRCKSIVTIHNFYTHTKSKKCKNSKENILGLKQL